MTIPDIYAERTTFSRIRITELSNRIAASSEVKPFADLTIFTAGSYGRLEASEHSDIDLFFVHDGNRLDLPSPRTDELRLFGKLIELAESMDFPPFSNDSEYLEVMSSADILAYLGSRDDDFQNLFTMRMLMLLESKCLHGPVAYEKILRELINSYYRDYPDHQASFEPWFLLNDIGRFWKTLLLNYEHKRNQTDETDKTKQKVRNFKLKFSRMTTCFATIAALGSHASVHEEDVLRLITLTPRERIQDVATTRPSTKGAVDDVLGEYAWFLEQTALPEPDLYALFEDKSRRNEMFKRANAYGDRMFTLLEAIDRDNEDARSGFLRYLVI